MREADTVGALIQAGRGAVRISGQIEAANPLFCRSGYATGLGGNYDASRNRVGTELRFSFGLWRDSQCAWFQLTQRQNAELQRSQRAEHAGACDIGSAGG
jgi:hypothetical protein